MTPKLRSDGLDASFTPNSCVYESLSLSCDKGMDPEKENPSLCITGNLRL